MDPRSKVSTCAQHTKNVSDMTDGGEWGGLHFGLLLGTLQGVDSGLATWWFDPNCSPTRPLSTQDILRHIVTHHHDLIRTTARAFFAEREHALVRFRSARLTSGDGKVEEFRQTADRGWICVSVCEAPKQQALASQCAEGLERAREKTRSIALFEPQVVHILGDHVVLRQPLYRLLSEKGEVVMPLRVRVHRVLHLCLEGFAATVLGGN
mmetsp:Transcript_42520/g.112187  ORF Transcript_42520/g.112187 Transcript_42520/m.112187 type:complete len:209 (-) Transcript_42520:177-803(-)